MADEPRIPGPMEDMVALLSRISEHTRMARTYLGWMLAIQLVGIAVAVVLYLNSGGDDGTSFGR